MKISKGSYCLKRYCDANLQLSPINSKICLNSLLCRSYGSKWHIGYKRRTVSLIFSVDTMNAKPIKTLRFAIFSPRDKRVKPEADLWCFGPKSKLDSKYSFTIIIRTFRYFHTFLYVSNILTATPVVWVPVPYLCFWLHACIYGIVGAPL